MADASLHETAALVGCTLADSATHPDWSRTPAAVLARCAEDAVAVVRVACVHEHVTTAFACATCVCELQRCEGILVCGPCGDGTAAHDCPAVLSIEWLGQPEAVGHG